jgi:hypothetical protein
VPPLFIDSKPDTENCGLLADEQREENSDSNCAIRMPLVPNSVIYLQNLSE